MTEQTTTATVYVDPQCPFAWIAWQWMRQVAEAGAAVARLELMSLACVNEHQELDPDYRAYNDDAWAAARVAAALLASPDSDRWPEFYATYGRRRHVDGIRDNRANLEATLRELGLPGGLLGAADDPAWDDDLRRRTTAAVDGVDPPGGTPITRVAGRAYFGPVLTAVPAAAEAVALWHALDGLRRVPGFASVATRRTEELDTGR